MNKLKNLSIGLLFLISLFGLIVGAGTFLGIGPVIVFGQYGSPETIASTSFSVSTTATTGAFTCDFRRGYTCIITRSDNSLGLAPTITGLPTNKRINFVFNSVTATGVAHVDWPTSSPQVLCSNGDGWDNCGDVNGWVQPGGIRATWAWSDGTNIYFSGDAGFFQTAQGAHGNFIVMEMGKNSTNGALELLWGGAVLAGNNAAGTDTAPTLDGGGTGTTCGSGAAFKSSSFPTTNRMDIVIGSTNPTTECPVTFGNNAKCTLATTCIASDESTFQSIKCVPASDNSGFTLKAATDMHGDTIRVITICAGH